MNCFYNKQKLEKDYVNIILISTFFQKISYFIVEFETRQKPETRLSKTRTRLSKSAKTRPEPEPDCPKPEPARPRLSQTRSITNPLVLNFDNACKVA